MDRKIYKTRRVPGCVEDTGTLCGCFVEQVRHLEVRKGNLGQVRTSFGPSHRIWICTCTGQGPPLTHGGWGRLPCVWPRSTAPHVTSRAQESQPLTRCPAHDIQEIADAEQMKRSFQDDKWAVCGPVAWSWASENLDFGTRVDWSRGNREAEIRGGWWTTGGYAQPGHGRRGEVRMQGSLEMAVMRAWTDGVG